MLCPMRRKAVKIVPRFMNAPGKQATANNPADKMIGAVSLWPYHLQTTSAPENCDRLMRKASPEIRTDRPQRSIKSPSKRPSRFRQSLMAMANIEEHRGCAVYTPKCRHQIIERTRRHLQSQPLPSKLCWAYCCPCRSEAPRWLEAKPGFGIPNESKDKVS
jgi:hypothetical protein